MITITDADAPAEPSHVHMPAVLDKADIRPSLSGAGR
jgi:hypothetical protein